MKKQLTMVGAVLSMGLALAFFNLGGVAGCGGGSSNSSGTGGSSGSSVTSTQASTASASSIAAALRVLSVGGTPILKVASDQTGLAIQDALTVAQTSSCSVSNLPNPSGSFYSGTISGPSSGSAAVKVDSSSSSNFSALITFTNYNDGSATISGSMGVTLSVSGSTATVSLMFSNFSAVVSGTTVDSLDMDLTVTVNGSSETIDGCVGNSNGAFTLSGSLN